MITTRFVALALALIATAGIHGNVCDWPDPGVQAPPARHHFGMDWKGAPEHGINLRFPDKVIDCFDRWHALPDRIEQATSWGTFATGAMAATMVLVLGFAVVYIVRKRE